MKRRDFIKHLAALGVTAALPSHSFANTENMTQALNIKALFNEALANNDSLLGFANVEHDFAETYLQIEGSIPKDLKGHFYRNGPARHERGDTRYRHLFEGDGMIQKFSLEEGKIKHKGRFVDTPKYKKEEAAQRFLYSGPDTKLADSLPVSSADHVNTANTNIIAVNDDIWALWEGGSASAIDANSLSFKKFVNVGEGTPMSKHLQGLPFSAHPKIDPNGDIWNFGLNPSGDLVLYHLSSKGKLKNVKLIRTAYKGGFLHDFLITQRYVLIILPSLVRKHDNSRSQGLFTGATMNKNLPMHALVIDKNTLTVNKRFELPPGFVFHFGNAWEDKNGSIHFDASLYDDSAVIHELSDLMSGKRVDEPCNAYTALFTLHTNGGVSKQAFSDISEFPKVCGHINARQNRFLFHVSGQKNSLWNDAIVAKDLQKETSTRFEYGPEYLVEEHIPVCPTNTEGQGYLIGTALHIPSKRTCLNIFDMSSIEQGPLARAWLPYHLPLGFHGMFAGA